MNALLTEKIINRTRFVFIIFISLAGLSAYNSGSVPAVYLSIFIATSIYLALTIVNLVLIRTEKINDTVIWVSLTIEVLLIFVVKYVFGFDEYNGFGMTLKEPATFLVYFLFGINSALRYNKKLNIYFGILAVSSYAVLIILGVTIGGMYFTTDQKEVFTPKALKFSHEISKLLFLGVFTYFLYLMADFTNKNIKKTEDAKNDAGKNLERVESLLDTLKDASQDLSVSSMEMSGSTNDIGKIIDETNRLIKEITSITQSFSKSIGEFRKKINLQSESIEQNFQKISQISNSMEVINNDCVTQKSMADRALELAEVNERNMKRSTEVIREMQEKSKKIEEITKTINEIADKTNLLSLNAAIESARAGEYGKGFAVVSDEISKLASVSLDSSKEISMIIKDTVQNIDEVYQSSENMSSGLNYIIDFVKKDSEFIMNLSARTENESKESRILHSSNTEIEKTTKDLIEHFNTQTELILQILEWMEKMTSMTEQTSLNLNSLMILSHRLESRSVEMTDLLEKA
ncbi:MAG: methyl-accepting chemotaxis protein [Spirochaetes bacterium]|jgi:methyl-accepting chemotaxis protein|nr:methyl-accepting chemotaxis protein [Spirochaetota bacterium]